MQALLAKCILLALTLALPGFAQEAAAEPKPDRVTLSNGDVLRGKVLSLVYGKMKFESPVLGVLEISLDQITYLQTSAPVTIETGDGERLQRRITGISEGQVSLGEPPSGTSAATRFPKEQLNAINPPEKRPEKWTGSVRGGLYFFSGNTDRRGGNLAVDASRRTEQDRITAGVAWSYAEDKTNRKWNLTQRRTEGRLQYDYFVDDRSYLLATTTVEGDTFQDIDLRYTAGAGYGFQWSETDDLSFSTELGVNYFSENFRSATPDNNYTTLRAAYSLKWKIRDGVRFLQDVQFFPSLENADDIYLKKDSRLRLDLLQDMFTELQWQLDYDNTPSPGLDRIDNRFFLNLGWEF